MSVAQGHPLDSVEVAPQVPPLMEAFTEEQHLQGLSEEQAKVSSWQGG